MRGWRRGERGDKQDPEIQKKGGGERDESDGETVKNIMNRETVRK